MNKIFRIFLVGAVVLFSTSVYAQNYPAKPSPARLVNDFANILNSSEKAGLENKLVQYSKSTSTQVAVVTIASLEGNDVGMYATELAQQWGIGQEGKDNGVLLLIAKSDKKMFIATGYGLEGVLPDAICKRIIENYMKPNFRAGNFHKGIDEATTMIFGLASGEFKPHDIKESRNRTQSSSPYAKFILILVVLGFVAVSRYSSYKSYRITNMGSSTMTFMAFMMLSSSSQHGGYGGFSSGGGSFGGGGFGGFGGGGFGGGGAGGSW